MADRELINSMIGFFAYERGATDSGIHDDAKKAQIKAHLLSLSETDQRVFLARFVREAFLTEEGIELGYGLEDVEALISWLNDWLFPNELVTP